MKDIWRIKTVTGVLSTTFLWTAIEKAAPTSTGNKKWHPKFQSFLRHTLNSLFTWLQLRARWTAGCVDMDLYNYMLAGGEILGDPEELEALEKKNAKQLKKIKKSKEAGTSKARNV